MIEKLYKTNNLTRNELINLINENRQATKCRSVKMPLYKQEKSIMVDEILSVA